MRERAEDYAMRQAMEISHVEVRRHPIWKVELRSETQLVAPSRSMAPSGRLVIATVFGVIAVATALVVGG